MASPAAVQATRSSAGQVGAAGPAGPLDGLRLECSGPHQLTAVAAEHLRLLGAAPSDDGDTGGTTGRLTLAGEGFSPCTARLTWADGHVDGHVDGEGDAGARRGLVDEATVQAATGVMAVHGRRDGAPRGLAVDYTATAASVLAVQGMLAALLAQARGLPAPSGTAVSAERAGLLAVSQYLAAAGADEGEAVEIGPGGPPFTSADGTLFELETLDPGAWAAFWRALDAPADAVRAGWRPFQFRYATACAPFPEALHEAARARPWRRIQEAAAASGAQVCAPRTLAERAAEHDGAPPWTFARLAAAPPLPPGARRTPAPATAARPLAGLTVLEAGRRIQAPLAAHLLGLLGADVIRIEPPGGDPLRGMPPACSGVSARWLALNRGKQAVELDIKAEAGRRRLRELAAEADVFLHNWAPGKAAQLGLDAADLSPLNPALVFAYTSGWADRLPDAPMGTDFMVQARTGVGEAVRPADEPPAPSLMTLLDVLGGLLGAEAVVAALLLRERTGHGVRVDSSLLSAADTLTAPALHRAATGRPPRRPAGFRRPLRTADGWLTLPDDAPRPSPAAPAAPGSAAPADAVPTAPVPAVPGRTAVGRAPAESGGTAAGPLPGTAPAPAAPADAVPTAPVPAVPGRTAVGRAPAESGGTIAGPLPGTASAPAAPAVESPAAVDPGPACRPGTGPTGSPAIEAGKEAAQAGAQPGEAALAEAAPDAVGRAPAGTGVPTTDPLTGAEPTAPGAVGTATSVGAQSAAAAAAAAAASGPDTAGPAEAPAEGVEEAAEEALLGELPTAAAAQLLRARGIPATPVTEDLAALRHDPRFTGSISLDAHGAPAVPDPWTWN